MEVNDKNRDLLKAYFACREDVQNLQNASIINKPYHADKALESIDSLLFKMIEEIVELKK